jgi:hypothetical protein
MSVVDLAHRVYEARSGAASTICRQLGFAGIALIWAFRVVDGENVAVPQVLLLPAALIVASLALDLFHYAVASAMWAIVGRVFELRENRGKLVPSRAPRWMNYPAVVLFWLKLAAMAAAYYLLLRYLAARVC